MITIRGGLLLAATLLLLVGCGDDDAARRDPVGGGEAPMVWGALGDSQTDEYHGDDARGDETVLNWLELLVVTRDLNFGEWSDRGRGEPRRRGFEHNWARSGARMTEVVDQQLAGLAAQIEAGEVTHAVLFSTANEWVNRSPYLMNAIYESPDAGRTDATGVAVDRRVEEISGRIVRVMERLSDAVRDAGAGGGVVILTPMDYVRHPGVMEVLADPARRAYVAGAIEEIHSIVAARGDAINTAAGRTLVVVHRVDEDFRRVWSSADGRYVAAAGVQLDYTRDTTNGDPHHLALAPTGGSPHMGTIGNGVLAQTFIDAANRLPGVEIPQLTDAEIRAAAGLGSD